MCMLLYVSAPQPLTPVTGPDLSLSRLPERASQVVQHFRFPHVYLLIAHGECSCDFPSVIASEPLEWYEGLFNENWPRAEQLRSATALAEWLKATASEGSPLELYPISYDDEGKRPLGRVRWSVRDMHPERLIFTQGFLVELTA